jgi:adenylate cyclase
MPDLIAQGTHPRERWRRALPSPTLPKQAADPAPAARADCEPSRIDPPRIAPPAGTEYEIVVGRLGAGVWETPWDDRISRRHVTLTIGPAGAVMVRKVESARNPVFYRGQRQDSFRLQPGEHFVIGHTTFTLAVRPEACEAERPRELAEHLYEEADLRGRGFRDGPSRIEALSRLPEIIRGSSSDEELLVRVVSLLLHSIPAASAVAVLDFGSDQPGQPTLLRSPRVLHYDHRIADLQGPRPSAGLARQALATRQSVLHLWGSAASDSGPPRPDRGRDPVVEQASDYTASEGIDWAYCVPLPNDCCAGWVIYVTGPLLPTLHSGRESSRQTAADDFRDDIKYTELVGSTLAQLRMARQAEQQQIGLRRFFGPVVMEAIAGKDPDEVLRPRMAELAVIFCDLRGFSEQSERSQEQLLDLLARVSDAMGVMTGEILRLDGVVGDFHGDSAMGFWGWPVDQSDAVGRACRAALRIREQFYDPAGQPRFGFRCGIGIASGQAVAGRIGTRDQVKVTAFGPIVNLASRLEGMTKTFAADVLVDDPSAAWVRQHVAPSQMRLRRLAKLRPEGFAAGVMVHQLLGGTEPSGWAGLQADKESYEQAELAYQAALDQFLKGDWPEAAERLGRLPRGDRPTELLLEFMRHHDGAPPPGWDGVIDIAKTGTASP